MAGPEATIEQACRDRAALEGALLLKVKFPGLNGCPDRLLFVPSYPRSDAPRAVFVEFKRAGEKPTKAQALMHEFLRRASLVVWVIDSVLDFEERLLELLDA